MKRFLLALLLLPALAIGAGNDLVMNQRLPDDSSQISRLVTKPPGTNDGVLGYLGSTQRPYFLQLGTGIQLSGGVLSATPTAQVNADWNAVSGPAFINNKPNLFSGAYADLTGKPALFSGSYGDLTGVPLTFSPSPHTHAAADIVSGTLALARLPALPISQTTGLQTALDGKYPIPVGTTSQYLRGDGSLATFPSIPAAQVQSDWNSVTPPSAILNKPALATVATTGAYADLSGKPTIPAAQVQTDWNAVSGLGVLLNKPATFPPSAHNQAWSTITATPTTIAGYGLTDAASLTQLATKFNNPSGTTSQYIRGDGSVATLPIAKRLETYTGTTNASGQIIVTYPVAFAAIPNVQTPPPALASQVWTLTASTTTGFTAVLNQRNVVTLLGLEVLLGAVVPVSGSAAQIVVIER